MCVRQKELGKVIYLNSSKLGHLILGGQSGVSKGKE
jgi:hypothetical protein